MALYLDVKIDGDLTAGQARDKGVAVVLFAPNTKEDLETYCNWPVDMLITDFPDLGPCP